MGNMKSKLHIINTSIKNSNRIVFIIFLTSALYILAYSFFSIYEFIKEKDIILFEFSSKEKSTIFLFFTSVIFAPIFETFFNQFLPYYLLNKVKYLHDRNYLILLASALFFGLLHFYSVFHILYAFLLGLVLMYGYMIRIKTDKQTFYLIALGHSFLNLGVFIKNLI